MYDGCDGGARMELQQERGIMVGSSANGKQVGGLAEYQSESGKH